MFNPINIQYFINTTKPKGNLVYEYNPLKVLRLSKPMDAKGKRPEDDGFDNGNVLDTGSIVDLDTDKLQFSLNNPVDIICQNSYDGSVNLILNDNKNIPRLINSRFSTRANNTYEIVDRIGDMDTNLYDEDTFDSDTSLYKRIQKIPKIQYNGLQGGDLKVGNYTIYIKYCDADDNETDFVAESGIISCFIGNDGDPFSVEGGFRDQLSNKAINITVNNIESSYNYIKVYYTRSTSDVDQNKVTTAYKIDQKFLVQNNSCSILITGNENTTEIPLSEINVQFFLADKVQAQAVCQNRLFIGNINKPNQHYEELTDLSLRILPYKVVTKSESLIGKVDNDYFDASGLYEYYNSKNIYNYVGYWNQEIYRLGIVYIMADGSLSAVYNIRGKNGIPDLEHITEYSLDNYSIYNKKSGQRQKIQYSESTYQINNAGNIENIKGVIRINDTESTNSIYGVGVFIPNEVVTYLQSLKVIGFFLVRQKRMPTILCQAFTMPMDSNADLPIIEYNGKGYIERFLNNNRELVHDYQQRLYTYKSIPINNQKAAICPEFEVNPAYYNQIFTGGDIPIRNADENTQTGLVISNYNSRIYQLPYEGTYDATNQTTVKIITVNDNTPIVNIKDAKFRGRAGEAEESYKFRFIKSDEKHNNASNLVRGSYYPYLGIYGDVESGKIINIYIPGYDVNKIESYFDIRYQDYSAYYAIGDRFALNELSSEWNSITPSEAFGYGYIKNFYRGDCYICNFTHRLNRNFQDPSAPTNDEIVDINTWKDHFDYYTEQEKLNEINRGDVNAVQLGSWITFKVRSSYNLSIRSLDPSYPSEEGLTGLKRGFYPLQSISTDGNTKIPNSYVFNKGYTSTVGEKVQFTLPEVPYIKNNFDTRIVYSDIAITDAFKNGFRVFQFQNYKDYPRTFGSIIKLVELYGNIICIFEHGVALIPVNERVQSGEGDGGNIFINTSNVLPENPKMLSDTYGSQWSESVLKTPYYIYGVDTVGKKIWRTNGQTFEIISDFKIQKFLNDNISLSERELTPIIGIRNVKTHYNAYKQDIMFTFYDNLHGFKEKVWNICYNELTQKFTTFYSWLPSYSANIDNIYFSFDRNTSKWISKLGTCSSKSTTADGIVVEEVQIDKWSIDENTYTILDIVNRPLPNTDKTGISIVKEFKLCKDPYKYYTHFDIQGNKLILKDAFEWKNKVIQLNIECNIKINYKYEDIPSDINEYIGGWKDYVSFNAGLFQSQIYLTKSEYLEQLTTDFWKHGQSGIVDIKDKIKPCYWYGKQHPFEFEFVVVDNPQFHKIFNNLKIISNKAEPESFHYEVIGEAYDFAEDKKNMFIRQEAIKDLYNYNGSDINYSSEFLELSPEQRKKGTTTIYNDKSTLFPLYYSRIDTINEIEDYYKLKTAANKDYTNLTGSEIIHDELLGEFKIWTHAKAADIKKVGRIRGNMNYQEDCWDVQINPIIFVQKNEKDWNIYKEREKIPLTIKNSPTEIIIDKDNLDIPEDLIKKGYTKEDVDDSVWNTGMKETKLRDKYIKIRVRYSGKDLAIITALKTLYTISYA